MFMVIFSIVSAVASSMVQIQAARASQKVQEQAAAEAAQFRHKEMILAEEQAALEQEQAHQDAMFRNAQLERQEVLVEQDVSLAELEATQAELNRRDNARRLAATNVAAFGGDPSSPTFRAFMASNEEAAEQDINNIRLQGKAIKLGLFAEGEQLGLQQQQNVVGAQFVGEGSRLGLIGTEIGINAANARDRARVRLAGIRSNAVIGRSLISAGRQIGQSVSSLQSGGNPFGSGGAESVGA